MGYWRIKSWGTIHRGLAWLEAGPAESAPTVRQSWNRPQHSPYAGVVSLVNKMILISAMGGSILATERMEINDGIYLVRVRTDDRKYRIYAVACARKDVLDEVLKVVPEGWSASLLTEQLARRDAAALNLKPGEVRDITQ